MPTGWGPPWRRRWRAGGPGTRPAGMTRGPPARWSGPPGGVPAPRPPVGGGRQPKILFAPQAGVRPPHFVLFTSGFLEAAYRRFVERRLREEVGFGGRPGPGSG